MDNMFKDITTLINIDINHEGNNKVKIKSMKEIFENCVNLIDFKIKGFDISEIKSFHKLFYNNEKLSNVLFNNFENNNI